MQLFIIYCSPVKQIGSSVLDFITTLIEEKFALICLCFLSEGLQFCKTKHIIFYHMQFKYIYQ